MGRRADPGQSSLGVHRLSIALASLVLGASEARADLYTWVDNDGNIHVTDVAADAQTRPYEGDDAEGFGGSQPRVMVLDTGEKRTLYPVKVSRYDRLLRQAAEHYGLPFAFLKAVAKVESNFNPRAVSHAKAKGLMQMIDPTAEKMMVSDPFDPAQSIFGGARYLRILANQFNGNLELTLAAYNAGPHRVRKAGNRVPEIRETQRYVSRVLQMVDLYGGLGG